MRSAAVGDLTTRARIRDAALSRFPKDGFGATTIRAIAADAGVSPALVVHHFGSKDGLRQTCDEYVVRRYREAKEAALEEENLYSPSFASTAYKIAEPLLRYLGWALARGHEAAGDLFDEMVKEGVALSRIAIEKGLVHDSSDLETRVAVQMAMQLGSVVMHSHLQRSVGVDLLTAEGLAAISPVLFELFGGLFEPEALERFKEAYRQAGPEKAPLTAQQVALRAADPTGEGPEPTEPAHVAIDPVCHMEVEVATTRWITAHDGETHYFCSPGCKAAFEKDPSAFLATEAT